MKLIKHLIIIFITIIISNQAKSNENIIETLKEGGKIIFIRHALAPGGGDPENFDINDCSTQRNLNDFGVEQSKNIGKFFIKNKIEIDQVLSSEWCRCKDTAFYAFKKYNTLNSLNSFFNPKFAEKKSKQIKNLKKFIKNWDSEKNLVLVTHYVVILEILNEAVNSGEIIVTDKNYNIFGSIETM